MVIGGQLYVFTQLPDLEVRTPQILRRLGEAGYEVIQEENFLERDNIFVVRAK